MLIWKNIITSNTGEFMVMFNIKSQCEIMSSVFALFRENLLRSNSRLLTTGVNIFLLIIYLFLIFTILKFILCCSQYLL